MKTTTTGSERWTSEATYAACAVGEWTAADEKAHRAMLKTAPEFGMFRDDRRDRKS